MVQVDAESKNLLPVPRRNALKGRCPMRHSLARPSAIISAVAYLATLTACSAPQGGPAAFGIAAPYVAHSTSVGKLEISRSGSGLTVRLINPKDGQAGSHQVYAKDKADCGKLETPCYIFSAVDGTAPMPISAPDCEVDKVDDAQIAYCKAPGVSAVTIDAETGGTIGYDASGKSEYGKNCFPAELTYEVGSKDYYSVLAWDGCHEKIHCAGHNAGTVDADDKDVIEGPCSFVNRH
jgi:hypothetical protein